MIKIAHLTDLHLPSKNEIDTHNINLNKNFEVIYSDLSSQQFDLVVITGDICFQKGDSDIYCYLKNKLDSLGTRYIILPGNHDNRSLIRKCFYNDLTISKDEIFFNESIMEEEFIFLDSSQDRITSQQFDWLIHLLQKKTKRQILFLHHPPLIADIPYMDKKYALINYEALQNILECYQNNFFIFCGHYHVEKTIFYKNQRIFITPSFYFQMSHHEVDFKVETHLIGYRIIEIGYRRFQTYLKMFEGNKIK